jgi:hypothetical protein
MDEPNNLRRRGKVNQEQPRNRKGARGQSEGIASKSGMKDSTKTIKADPKKPGRMKQTAPNRAIKAKSAKSAAGGNLAAAKRKGESVK